LGTTMPEAFVSVMAAWMGNPGKRYLQTSKKK